MAKKKKKPKAKVKKDKALQSNKSAGYEIISLDLIDDPEAPMRSDLTPENVEELVLSIKQVGLIEPIIVKPVKGRFEVIAGHRRAFACRLAKLVEVPCRIIEANSDQTEMLKIHENLYRQDISPADEAKHFDYLIQEKKLTPQQIAKLISKSASYVSDRLAILNYPDFLAEAMHKEEITFSVAREFARFDDIKQMRQAVYYAKRSGMTQEMARKWVKDFKRDRQSAEPSEAPQDGNGEAIAITEHHAQCIFCKQEVRMIEADVVYMHHACSAEARSIQPSTDVEPELPPASNT